VVHRVELFVHFVDLDLKLRTVHELVERDEPVSVVVEDVEQRVNVLLCESPGRGISLGLGPDGDPRTQLVESQPLVVVGVHGYEDFRDLVELVPP
jgi:hypothetical protein